MSHFIFKNHSFSKGVFIFGHVKMRYSLMCTANFKIQVTRQTFYEMKIAKGPKGPAKGHDTM